MTAPKPRGREIMPKLFGKAPREYVQSNDRDSWTSVNQHIIIHVFQYISNYFNIDYLWPPYILCAFCRAACILVVGAGIRSPKMHGAVVASGAAVEPGNVLIPSRTFRPTFLFTCFTYLPQTITRFTRFTRESFEGTAHLSLQQSCTRCLKPWYSSIHLCNQLEYWHVPLQSMHRHSIAWVTHVGSLGCDWGSGLYLLLTALEPFEGSSLSYCLPLPPNGFQMKSRHCAWWMIMLR
jgi:hypothetical protein